MIPTVKQKNSCMLCALVGTMAILSGLFLNAINHYINALLLVVSAIVLYFFMVFFADKNWLDLRATFTGVWLGTMGLSTLRLTANQEVWQKKTWIVLALAYLFFQIGATCGMHYGEKLSNAVKNHSPKEQTGKIYFRLRENRLFWVSLVTTLIGLVCFLINVAIKGYIPCFSDDIFAYIDFYTKFHLFAVAATMSAGLCYYCIKTQSIGTFKKIILWICIFYNMILFPILVVSRGVFVATALTFTSVVFYLNKKRFISLVLCLSMIMGIYLLTSSLRDFTDEQLNFVFSPIKIETPIPDKNTSSSSTSSNTHDKNDKDKNDKDKDDKDDKDSDSSNKNDTPIEPPSFMLSPKMSFLYGYLTVGHDNINEAVQNLDEYTWGTRSLAPFNVILRINALDEISASVDTYYVNPNLNTNNLIGTFYYDFHEYGVIVFMFLLSFVFALLQLCCEKFKNPFVLLAMSNTIQVIVLSFFENFTARFEFWMLWGVVLIFALISCINIKDKKSNP